MYGTQKLVNGLISHLYPILFITLHFQLLMANFTSSVGLPLVCGHRLIPTMNTTPKKDNGQKRVRCQLKRGAHAAAVINEKIYVVGGANRKQFNLVNTSALEVYDPIKDVWKKLARMPTARDHLIASSFDKKLYAIGGRTNVDFNNNLDTNEVYDPRNNLWTALSPLPTKRSGITSQVLNKNILVFGGEFKKGIFSKNEVYEPKTDTWKTFSPVPSGRHGLGSAYYRNRVHLFGGRPNLGGGGSNTHSMFSIKN